MNSQDKGNHAELRVAAALKQLGKNVLMPYAHDVIYDIVVEDDGEFTKLQVKSSRIRNGRVEFNCHSTPWTDSSEATQYQPSDIDGFAVYSQHMDECYYIPLASANDYTMTLNPDPDSKHPTSEYYLDDHFTP